MDERNHRNNALLALWSLDATRQRRHLYAVVVPGVWVALLGEQGNMLFWMMCWHQSRRGGQCGETHGSNLYCYTLGNGYRSSRNLRQDSPLDSRESPIGGMEAR